MDISQRTTIQLQAITDQLSEMIQLVDGIRVELTDNSFHSESIDSIGDASQRHAKRLVSEGEYVDLTATEAMLWQFLVKNPGVVSSAESICEALHLDPVAQRVNVKTYIHRLRTKLKKLTAPEYEIQAVRGAGYCAWPLRTDHVA